MFIKRYIIMNYETTKYRCRTSQTNQQGGEAAQKISIGAKGDKALDRGIWDLAATGVSLCARGGKAIEGLASTRGEASVNCEVAYEYDREGSEIEEQDQKKYQLDYNRIVEDLSKTKWNVKMIINGCWNLNMNLTG